MTLYTDHQQQGLDEYMVLICMMYAHIYVAALVSMILCVYMRDWIITSGYDSSPPPVNLQSPLIPSCCRESSSSSKLSRSDDAGCNNPSYCPSSFMYIFVSLDDVAGFILYRIDALHHLQHNINSPHDLNDLDPLLFFPSTGPDMQPAFFNCIKFGSKFYFFGLDHYFGANDSTTTTNCNVYTIEEKNLKAIKPGLHNDIHNFQPLFSKTKNPMHGPKYSPILFVANQKLFVLSQDVGSECIFEVFSPSDETWQPLPVPLDIPLGKVASLLVLKEQEQLVYFSAGHYILSFNLETHKWITPPHYGDIFLDDYEPDTSSSHPPTFQNKPVSIIADMAFGFRHHPYIIAKGNYICASQLTTYGGEELMQPNLAPDQAFLEVLRSSRFAYMDKHDMSYSDSLVALQDSDGKQVMCIVTYGIKPPDKTNFHVCIRTAYVALSFFDIPGDFYTLKDSPVQEHDVEMDASYADQKAEDGTVVRRYFSAKFRHTTHFVINDSHMFPRGQLVSCFT